MRAWVACDGCLGVAASPRLREGVGPRIDGVLPYLPLWMHHCHCSLESVFGGTADSPRLLARSPASAVNEGGRPCKEVREGSLAKCSFERLGASRDSMPLGALSPPLDHIQSWSEVRLCPQYLVAGRGMADKLGILGVD